MKLRPNLKREEKEELLALLEERNRRRERARVLTDREAILEKCSTLHGFIEEFWYVLEPTAKFVTGWPIRAMCDHLEAVHYGWIQNLLINVPPGMMKSLLVSVFFQAWEWGPMGRPDLRYLSTSYSKDNVHRDSNKVRKLVESEKYQALWGDQVRPGQTWGVEKFENTAGGNRDCRPFGSLTGGRGDRVLIDDPHSTTTAESDVQRKDTVKKFREGATDRLNDIARSATIVIMQRLHMKDVAGTILELSAEPDETANDAPAVDVGEDIGDGWVHLNLPMEFEPDRRCATVLRPANDGNPAILFEDPRTGKGELLFAERFPARQLARLKRFKGPYAWAGQYQQRPAPREGGMFSRDSFVPVKAVPAGARRMRKWDLAATEPDAGNTDPDWSVGALMAEDDLGFWYVEDIVRLRGSAAVVEAAIKRTAALDNARYGSVPIHLSQDPGQAGKAQVGYLVRQLPGYVVTFNIESGSKVTRADPFSAQVEAGNVRIVIAGWNEDYLEEAEVFPNGAHDDQIDATAGGFNQMSDTSKHAFAFA